MHRYGTLDIGRWGATAPTLTDRGGEPWRLRDVEILDCRTELDAGPADALVPPALRPAIPAYGALVFSRVAVSPVVAFTLAEIKVGVRVGAMQAFFLAAAICDNAAACELLGRRWGLRVLPGVVRLEQRYYEATGTALLDGRTALEVKLTERHALPGTRLSVPSLMTVARDGAAGELLLAGIPVAVVYSSADAGRAQIAVCDGELLGCGRGLRPTTAMSATIGVADVSLPPIELTTDPCLPAEHNSALATV